MDHFFRKWPGLLHQVKERFIKKTSPVGPAVQFIFLQSHFISFLIKAEDKGRILFDSHLNLFKTYFERLQMPFSSMTKPS